MDITIRKATAKDWQIIQKLNNEVFVDNYKYDNHLIINYANTPAGEAYFKKITGSSGYYCIIAELEEKAVGYLAAYPKIVDYRQIKTIELDNMGVTPAFRSQGVGRALVTELKRWAHEHGYQSLYVTAYAKNSRALSFYKQHGFSLLDCSLEMVLR